MRIAFIFVLVCVLIATFWFVNDNFLSSDYISDETVASDVPLLMIPINDYLDENSLVVDGFAGRVEDMFFDLDRKVHDLRDVADGFLDAAFAISDFFEAGEIDYSDPYQSISFAFMYQHDRSYFDFISSYISSIRRYYKNADFSFLSRKIYPGYDSILNYFTSYVTEKGSSSYTYSNYDSFANPPLLSVSPSLYFEDFGISPAYHLTIQDSLARFGVPHLYINMDFSAQGYYRIYQRYYKRYYDSDGNFVSELVNSVSTDWWYDPSSNSVIER